MTQVPLRLPLPPQAGVEVSVSQTVTHHAVPETKIPLGKIAGAAAGVAAAAGIAAGVWAMETHDAPDMSKISVANVAGSGFDALEDYGGYAVGAAALLIAGAATTKSGRLKLTLNNRGLSASEYSNGSFKRLVAGTLLPAAGVTSLASGLVINHGLVDGPTQFVQSMVGGVETAAGPDKTVSWVLQPGTKHYMNQSQITSGTVDKVRAAAKAHQFDISTVGAYRSELAITPTASNKDQAGMVVYTEAQPGHPSPVLPKVETGALCKVVDDRCDLKADELVVDKNEGFVLGQQMQIHGRNYTVAAFAHEHQSLIDREVVYGAMTPELAEFGYTGLVVVGGSDSAEQMIKGMSLGGQLESMTGQELIQNNADFWKQNGTPLILVVEAVALAGMMIASSRLSRFQQNRDAAQTATLRALGFSKGDTRFMKMLDASSKTLKGMAFAVAPVEAVSFGVESVIPGMQTHMAPGAILGGAAVMLAAQLVVGNRSSKVALIDDLKMR